MLDIVKDADNDNGVVLTEKRPGKFRGSDLLRQKQGKRGEGGGLQTVGSDFGTPPTNLQSAEGASSTVLHVKFKFN